MIVSGGQQRDSAIQIHVSMVPQTPLPSRLPQNTEQSSLCYTVGPCWLSVLKKCLLVFFFLFLIYILFVYLFDCVRSQLQHVGSLFVTCGIKFPDQGSNLGLLLWECRVLTTRPPTKSHVCLFLMYN